MFNESAARRACVHLAGRRSTKAFSVRRPGLLRKGERALVERGFSLGNSDQNATGKLNLRGSLADILQEQARVNGLQILSLQAAHVLALAGLPLHHHDPFDRMLIAQARHENWDIVSKDSEFKAYPVRVIW